MENDIKIIKTYTVAANYISAAQIYLQDNVLLERPLMPNDIKPRLLGHWGTCPGINFTYAHLNSLISDTKQEMLFILGPGHGFPALQANLWLEGSLTKIDPNITSDEKGLLHICKNFSWPMGYPSHSNPEAPGVILEGGELGYALATAYGSVLDNPDLVTTALIGDGEAETGPTATAWHLHRFIDPATNGTVLPILHLNGYKISGPTIFGRMTDKELLSLFNGYGYEPFIVDEVNDDVYQTMYDTLRKAYTIIQNNKKLRIDDKKFIPRPPMIILRTPKGWTGITELDGNKLAGNHLSHQVIAKDARTDGHHRQAIENWLRSYNFNDIFDKETGLSPAIRTLIPPDNLLMGQSKHAHGGDPVYQPLKLPSAETHMEDAVVPGTIGSSSMRRAGEYLTDVFKLNADNKNFRLFSPDETYSNKLDAVFRETARAWLLPTKDWDQDLAEDGRVVEMLSEHSLQGLCMGYILTGRHAVFASYEAFIQIISSMADQYAKFLKVAHLVSWRGTIPSLNYILTSSGWRQEHNGFSHQNPGFVNNMLSRQGCFVNAYFPPDGNTTLAVLDHCLKSTKQINIISAGKTQEPRWLTPSLAREAVSKGIMIWDFASEDQPDIVLIGIGDYMTKEALAAISIVKSETPTVKIRFVNVVTLNVLGLGNDDCIGNKLDLNDYFTSDKPMIFNFHGYSQIIKQALFDYVQSNGKRTCVIHGYEENGSTTTPFDMQVRNNTDRYHLAIDVFTTMLESGVLNENTVNELVSKYQQKLADHRQYIIKHGVDPDEIEQWIWKK